MDDSIRENSSRLVIWTVMEVFVHLCIVMLLVLGRDIWLEHFIVTDGVLLIVLLGASAYFTMMWAATIVTYLESLATYSRGKDTGDPHSAARGHGTT